MAFAGARQAFADAVDSHQGFGGADFAVEVVGCFVVAGCDIFLLGEVVDGWVLAGLAGDDG